MYLLDTNHCSLIILKNQTLFDYIGKVGETNIATSIITLGELAFMATNSKYREQNLTRLYQFISNIRVYYVDETTANLYGQIKANLIKEFGPKQKN